MRMGVAVSKSEVKEVGEVPGEQGLICNITRPKDQEVNQGLPKSFVCLAKYNNSITCCGEYRCCVGVGPNDEVTTGTVIVLTWSSILVLGLVVLITFVLFQCFTSRKKDAMAFITESSESDSSESVMSELAVCYIQNDTGQPATLELPEDTKDTATTGIPLPPDDQTVGGAGEGAPSDTGTVRGDAAKGQAAKGQAPKGEADKRGTQPAKHFVKPSSGPPGTSPGPPTGAAKSSSPPKGVNRDKLVSGVMHDTPRLYAREDLQRKGEEAISDDTQDAITVTDFGEGDSLDDYDAEDEGDHGARPL